MSQLSLLPIRLVDEIPADRTKSKDLLWIGVDDQDRRYAVKTVEADNPDLPLMELCCYQLCQLCGIPSPDFAIVTRMNGSLAFGSRWEMTASQYVKDETSPADVWLWMDRASDDISAMLALDAFLPNTDRHLGNILFRLQVRTRALAFDWSRACWPEPWPWPAACNSDQFWRFLVGNNLHKPDAVRRTLGKLAAIPHTEIRNLVAQTPVEWQVNITPDKAEAWWKNHASERAEATESLLLP